MATRSSVQHELEAVPGVVADVDVLASDRDQQLDQMSQLGPQRCADHQPFGRVDHLVERRRLVGDARVERAQRLGAVRVDEQAAGSEHRVVPRRAGARPVARQLLARLEDLLHHDPRSAGLVVQSLQISAWIGQPVRVVDPKAMDGARPQQLEQHLVRGVEDIGVLDADRGQRVDVEEPPVVQLLRGNPPVRQAVPLPVQQLDQRELPRCRAGSGRCGRGSAAAVPHRSGRP